MSLCFVIPWYGPDAKGGAETGCRLVAHHLADAGYDVEVLATCSRSFLDSWEKDYHRPGESQDGKVTVRRFRLDPRAVPTFDEINRRLMMGQRVSPDEERVFMREMINSRDLVEHIRRRGDRDAFVFYPYMFGTSYHGVLANPDRSVLMPALHDESYARMAPICEMFAKVQGVLFQSRPERDLANALYALEPGISRLVGLGVDDKAGEAERFRSRFGREPFVFYAGRKDAGKGTPRLIEAFSRYKDRKPGPLRLVLAGPGTADTGGRSDIVDLGYVSEQDKRDAYAAATVFCNPSIHEAFSIVLMEAWLAERPVLVNGRCAVTKDHVLAARGGLYFDTLAEFGEALDLLLSEPDLARRMGANGRQYVLSNFTWDVVVRRMIAAFEHWGLGAGRKVLA